MSQSLYFCASASKRGLVQNLSNKIGFDLHENEPVGETFSYCSHEDSF